jgi:hypothetical protein
MGGVTAGKWALGVLGRWWHSAEVPTHRVAWAPASPWCTARTARRAANGCGGVANSGCGARTTPVA